MSESGRILSENVGGYTAKERAVSRRMQSSRAKFNSYDIHKWEQTYFNGQTGGYVVTDLRRIPQNPEKNMSVEGKKYRKERSMSIDLANFGMHVKHLYEKPGVSSPDVNILRGRHSLVEVNGKTADLKDLNNSNNIRRESQDTFEIKKKADLIVFRFHQHDRKIANEIKKRQEKGEHGYYYYYGEDKLYEY